MDTLAEAHMLTGALNRLKQASVGITNTQRALQQSDELTRFIVSDL